MATFSDIATSLRVTTMLPLDHKRFSVNEAALAALGIDNNLAFTYYDGLKVFCWAEKSEWIWREVVAGDTAIKLLASDFTYPNGAAYPPNPSYDGKKYNFHKLVPGEETRIVAGTNITVTGKGSTAAPYIINATATYTPPASDIPPLQRIDEGNGSGIIIRGRVATTVGNIGFNAIDLSRSETTTTFWGATGADSFAQGVHVNAGAVGSISMGSFVTNSQIGSVVIGNNSSSNSEYSIVLGKSNLTNGGRSNTILGTANRADGCGITTAGQACLIYAPTTYTDFNTDLNKPVFLVGNGTVDNTTNSALIRSNAFAVRFNGLVEAPSLTIAGITAGIGRTLITKEYLTSQTLAFNKPYKEYVAILSQTVVGAAPTILGGTALQNELGGDIVWTWSSTGSYRGTLLGAFPVAKTVVMITAHDIVYSHASSIQAFRTGTDFIDIRTYANGVLTDGAMISGHIMIRVYN